MFIRFDKAMADKVKIVKIGSKVSSAPAPVVGSSRRRSMRTFPHGVLKGGKTAKAKISPVRDPAKAPPISKRKATLRILTEKGAEKKRRKIKQTVRSMPDHRVKALLKASGLPVSDKIPPHLAKEILEGGMEAGMIVAN